MKSHERPPSNSRALAYGSPLRSIPYGPRDMIGGGLGIMLKRKDLTEYAED